MNRQQLYRLMKVAIVATFIILLLECIFTVPAVSSFFTSLIKPGASEITFYCIVWTIMFLQVTILNIPAYSVLTVCNSIMIGGVFNFTYICVVMSAYMCGCMLAYYIGYRYGRKAVQWAAGSEQEYDKWSKVINGRAGKMIYFGTVLLPVFPDDILCLVAGATRMNFWYYFVSNLVGRTIGLTTMCYCLGTLLKNGVIGGSFPTMCVVWGVALLVELVVLLVLRKGGASHADE